jgi:hypothetical protein
VFFVHDSWGVIGGPFLSLGLFILGTFLLAYEGVSSFFRERPSIIFVVLLWILITFIAVISYTPMNWTRYYLPLIPCIAIAQAYGISRIVKLIWLKLLKRFIR